jgi:hypothetical protein
MSSQTIFCLASSRGRADRILHELKIAKFSTREIGVFFLDRNSADGQTKDWDPAGSPESVESASPVRGVLAWVSDAGCFVVPGVGPVVAAGTIAASIKQSRIDGTATTIAQELINLGFCADAAARYERQIGVDGDILISVDATSAEMVTQVRELFMDLNASDICTSEKCPPSSACPAAQSEESSVSLS